MESDGLLVNGAVFRGPLGTMYQAGRLWFPSCESYQGASCRFETSSTTQIKGLGDSGNAVQSPNRNPPRHCWTLHSCLGNGVCDVGLQALWLWLYQSLTAHQHQKGHTVPKQVSPLEKMLCFYSLRTALCKSIRYQTKSEQNVRQDLIPRVRHGEAALMHPIHTMEGRTINAPEYSYIETTQLWHMAFIGMLCWRTGNIVKWPILPVVCEFFFSDHAGSTAHISRKQSTIWYSVIFRLVRIR